LFAPNWCDILVAAPFWYQGGILCVYTGRFIRLTAIKGLISLKLSSKIQVLIASKGRATDSGRFGEIPVTEFSAGAGATV